MYMQLALAAVFSLIAIQGGACWADDTIEGGFKASTFVDTEVKNETGSSLGTIRELVLDEDGSVGYAVLSSGGFLDYASGGFFDYGSKYFAVPWDALTWSDGRRYLILDVPEDKPVHSLHVR